MMQCIRLVMGEPNRFDQICSLPFRVVERIYILIFSMYKLAVLNYAAKRMLNDPRRMSLPSTYTEDNMYSAVPTPESSREHSPFRLTPLKIKITELP